MAATGLVDLEWSLYLYALSDSRWGGEVRLLFLLENIY